MARDWNKAYETGDTPWDKGYAAPPLTDLLQRRSIVGDVLVPGCGTGHDVRALAGQGADVVGLDLAPAAIEQAEVVPVVGTERYELGNFLDLPDGHVGCYDWVFEHTCLCAIEPSERIAYANALRKALRPGGRFLAIFFREVSDYSGDGPPHPIACSETDALFTDAFELEYAEVPSLTYPSRPAGAEELCIWRLKA